ncbi:MAG: response regulator [Prochlorotrichaceae cyanobacterium]|jgi:two-component system NarL family response regulator
MSPLQILLIEDDELFRLGLRVRLEQETDLAIVAEAVDGESALTLLTELTIDVVLLDVGLPGLGGLETCRQIKQRYPHLPILVLTSHTQSALIQRLIEAKVQGYCLKGLKAEQLVLAIRSVATGASWWDPVATEMIQSTFTLQSAELPTESSSSPVLTQREQEILRLIAAGKTNTEIAALLYITTGTVRVHVHTILKKLDVRDRTQAAILAIQKGLV